MADSDRQEIEERFKAFHEVLRKYEEDNPGFLHITAFRFLLRAVPLLKDLIEDPEEREVTWENPSCELFYMVEIDWETHKPIVVKEEDLTLPLDLDKPSGKVFSSFLQAQAINALKALAGPVYYTITDGGWTPNLPEDITEELKRLGGKKGERYLDSVLSDFKEIQKGLNPLKIKIPFQAVNKKTNKISRGSCQITVEFLPFEINRDIQEAYYPISIALSFTKLQPPLWNDESKKLFWLPLLSSLNKMAPAEKLPEAVDFLPEPKARPVRAKERRDYVRASAHLIKQLHGPVDDLPLMELIEKRTVLEEAIEAGVKVIGIEPSWGGLRAIHAINVLLTKGKYRKITLSVKEYVDDAKAVRYVDNPLAKVTKDLREAFSFSDLLPYAEIKPTEYYKAYGIEPVETRRGWYEYPQASTEAALNDLKEAGTRPFIFRYERLKRDEDDKVILKTDYRGRIIKTKYGKPAPEKELVEAFRPLCLVDFIYSDVKGERLKEIRIIPSPIFIDEVMDYYILYPKSLPDDILRASGRKGKGRPPKYQFTFILWLHLRVIEDPEGYGAGIWKSIHLKTLAKRLRMDTYLESGSKGRIREILSKCFDVAKNLGYLAEVKERGDLYDLRLNPDMFITIKTESPKMLGSFVSHEAINKIPQLPAGPEIPTHLTEEQIQQNIEGIRELKKVLGDDEKESTSADIRSGKMKKLVDPGKSPDKKTH